MYFNKFLVINLPLRSYYILIEQFNNGLVSIQTYLTYENDKTHFFVPLFIPFQ